MTREIFLHESVVRKLEAATEWYEEQQVGLGRDFTFEFESLAEHIVQIPYGFPKAFGDYRQVMLKRFPFIIIYRIEGEIIEIANLIHAKQHPRKRKRIQ